MRLLKWLGTLLCILILTAFLYSTRRVLSWHSMDVRHEFSLILGAIESGWRPDGWRLEDEKYPPLAGWSVAHYGGSPSLIWSVTSSRNSSWEGISVPLWIPFVVVAAPTALLWYRDRRNLPSTLHRLATFLTPGRPKRTTILRVILCSVVHGVAVVCAFATFTKLYDFFVPFRSGDIVPSIAQWSLVILFWTTPLWGIVWATLWVRLVNRLYKRRPGRYCYKCGYDLTANVTGICPECGTPTSPTAPLP